MRSKIFNLNWETFDFHDPEQKKQLMGALQYFLAKPDKFLHPKFDGVQEFVKFHKEYRQALELQMFTTPSDLPTRPSEVLRTIQAVPDYDIGYEAIFDIMDFTGTNESGFDVLGLASGLTFKEVKPGEKLKVYQMAGGKERCYFAYYGGALGWFRGIFDDKQYWEADRSAKQFRNVAYALRSRTFYGLLEAAADLKGCCKNLPMDCSGCDADARAMARSINYAALTILRNCENKGYALNPATTQIVVLSPLELQSYIREALNVRLQAISDAAKIVNFNFVHISSLMPTNHGRVLVILPKFGLLGGYRMDLTMFEDFDMLSYTDAVAGWMRYGGCIADLDQIECIEFAVDSGSCPPSDQFQHTLREPDPGDDNPQMPT